MAFRERKALQYVPSRTNFFIPEAGHPAGERVQASFAALLNYASGVNILPLIDQDFGNGS